MNTTNSPSTHRRIISFDGAAVQPTMDAFRVPLFDSASLPHALQLSVYVPGVETHGIEIAIRGTDLFVTARKSQFVRPNWQSLHLESAQRDYGLQLRLGNSLDLTGLQAELNQGILMITIPTLASPKQSTRPPSVIAA